MHSSYFELGLRSYHITIVCVMIWMQISRNVLMYASATSSGAPVVQSLLTADGVKIDSTDAVWFINIYIYICVCV